MQVNLVLLRYVFPLLCGSLAGWFACRVGLRAGIESVTHQDQTGQVSQVRPTRLTLTQRLRRAIRCWLGVSADLTYPHRIVTLINYRGSLLGIDGNGDFYEINRTYSGYMDVQLLMRNPLERGAREFEED